MIDSANICVKRGFLTFNSGGDNVRSSPYYSRVVHYPNRDISGVTIGRGYDLGGRSPAEIFTDLTRAGVSKVQAKAISKGAGLRGREAAEFVRKNRVTIGEITERQQADLFNQIYPFYERRAKIVYNMRTAHIHGRPEWVILHPAIREVLIDIVYQGYQARKTMLIAANNNLDEMINFIRSNSELTRDERGRNRAGYLDKCRESGE